MESKRKRMDINERAKQFSPFSPLNGLNKALRERELKISKLQRSDCYEETNEELNIKLKIIDHLLNTKVTKRYRILYFKDHCQYKIEGTIKKIDKEKQNLFIDQYIIPFDSLLSIEFI